MSVRLEYCAVDRKHITLRHDGSIELYLGTGGDEEEPVVIASKQAKMLRAILLAHEAIEKEAR